MKTIKSVEYIAYYNIYTVLNRAVLTLKFVYTSGTHYPSHATYNLKLTHNYLNIINEN